MVDNVRKCETSVEEIILEAIKAPEFISKQNIPPRSVSSSSPDDSTVVKNGKKKGIVTSVKDQECAWFSQSKFSSSGKNIKKSGYLMFFFPVKPDSYLVWKHKNGKGFKNALYVFLTNYSLFSQAVRMLTFAVLAAADPSCSRLSTRERRSSRGRNWRASSEQ